jgi:hypothetical protein
LNTETVSSASGKLLVYIGSYGLNLRGNQLRFHINNGSDTELTPRPNSTQYAMYIDFFDDGGYMDLTVTLTDTGVTFDIVAVNSRGSSHTFSYTYENVRIANEIASSEAKITVKIDPTQVSEVILSGEDGTDTPETTVPNFFDYMNSKETITLNSGMTSVTSDLAVGYGKTVRIPLDTQIVSTGSGRMLVYIGSYGLNMRGNSLRFHINDGSDTEIKPRPNSTEYMIYNNFFDDGGYMDLTVTLTDTGVTFDIVAVNSRGSSHTFTYTYENVRIANEIASADAKITVKIDPTQVSEVILAP